MHLHQKRLQGTTRAYLSRPNLGLLPVLPKLILAEEPETLTGGQRRLTMVATILVATAAVWAISASRASWSGQHNVRYHSGQKPHFR